jgi:hypothetical protein
MKVQSASGSLIPNATLALSLLLAAPLHTKALCQDRATVTVEENIRAEPQGTVIGRAVVGSTLQVQRVDGNWVEIDLEGWIWSQSVEATDRPGFDLSVSASPSENLRTDPQGPVVARLLEGALLENLDARPGWVRVRRIAWIWGPSLTMEARERQGAARTAPERERASEQEGWWRGGNRGAPILAGPNGDTLAHGLPDTEFQVLARQGNWIRVRLEGWVWAPSGEETDSVAPGVISAAGPDEVMRDPAGYRGQVVSWELQFMSMEEAERIRTDFYEGEPFLLTRATTGDRAFVYVAVPPERLADIQGLIPLEMIHVVGRVRTGAAALTGSPILDLLELTRISRG